MFIAQEILFYALSGSNGGKRGGSGEQKPRVKKPQRVEADRARAEAE